MPAEPWHKITVLEQKKTMDRHFYRSRAFFYLFFCLFFARFASIVRHAKDLRAVGGKDRGSVRGRRHKRDARVLDSSGE